MPAAKEKDLGQAEAQKRVDAAEEQGYLGVRADVTPLHHYTVDGVTSGKPTPETDPKQAAKVEAHQADLPV